MEQQNGMGGPTIVHLGPSILFLFPSTAAMRWNTLNRTLDLRICVTTRYHIVAAMHS